jgi:uncharacterized protein YbjT (DUF2867 family)
VLIVGATGGLGQDVVAEALARGYETRALVRNPEHSALPANVEIVRGDVLDPSSLTDAVRGRDAVICALGTPSPRRTSALLEQGTENLVDAMSRQGASDKLHSARVVLDSAGFVLITLAALHA